MIENGKEDIDEDCRTFETPFLVKSKITYRFQNLKLLELCNIMSSQRPAIHSEMISGINMTLNEKADKLEGIDETVSKIFELLDKGVHPENIAVVSPYTENQTKIKKEFRTILDKIILGGAQYKEREISTGFIYASAIPSIKGLEFDYVFFVGSSNFPNYMLSVLSDSNDAMSMNFVVNTRAKKKIFYVTDSTFAIPEDVPEEFTNGKKSISPQVNINKKIQPYVIRSEDIQPENYKKMEENMRPIFSIPKIKQESYSFPKTENIQNLKYEIISSVLMKLDGLTTPMQIGKTQAREEDEYMGNKNVGKVFDMRFVCPSNRESDYPPYWLEKQRPLIGSIYGKYSYEDVKKHIIFKKLMTGKDSELKSMDNIADIVFAISRLLEKEKGNWAFKQNIVNSYITASTIQNDNCILIFTECTYIGLYMKKLNPMKNIYIVSFEDGEIYKLDRAIYSLKRYEYQIKFILALYSHFKFMRISNKYSIAGINSRKPDLIVDSEFGPRKYNKSNTIYDYCLININDPFLSVSTYLTCDEIAFNSLMFKDKSLQYKDFINCPTFSDLANLLRMNYYDKNPIIHYYNASHDLSIFYETEDNFVDKINESREQIIEDYKKTEECKKFIIEKLENILEEKTLDEIFIGNYYPLNEYTQDLNPVEKEQFLNFMQMLEISKEDDWSFKKSTTENFTFEDEYDRVKKGKLSEVYIKECETAITSLNYLSDLHISYTDTLLLTEMVCKRKYSRK